MRAILEMRLSALKQKSFDELAELPPTCSEQVMTDSDRSVVTTWKDATDAHELRIVVQVYRPWRFGIGRMTAHGFRINESGAIRDLRADELYEFS